VWYGGNESRVASTESRVLRGSLRRCSTQTRTTASPGDDCTHDETYKEPLFQTYDWEPWLVLAKINPPAHASKCDPHPDHEARRGYADGCACAYQKAPNNRANFLRCAEWDEVHTAMVFPARVRGQVTTVCPRIIHAAVQDEPYSEKAASS